jgi:hypothetical protein
MTDYGAALNPRFTHYHEWVGYEQAVSSAVIEKAKADIENNGGDWEAAVATLMYFKDQRHGYVYVVCAPLKTNSDLFKRRMT